ncbi:MULTISPECIES: glucose-6-phosphate isomerase [unclassified Beijerinckia]|uniref:glucose-6-phosphate isomerase n=1 Tax=unclassified Beijerinckia TaxID=2638183 RepID=UPI00089A3121|nr:MULTISPECIES: glucose-6-phosphate isomerase [unclassified Beijerinckia]MDH7796751.1 glucose-6-phosphate isomerase [Beijerinckia sp. GAS462]SEC58381.1 glucose-6-phosphate isomerase [Beijerinckia sp. 28-YEA-48]
MAEQSIAAAFAALKAHKTGMEGVHTADLFKDAGRFQKFHARLDDLLFDYSKHRVTAETMEKLFALARTADVEGRRKALFAGEHVNFTEGRAAMHMALRNVSGRPVIIDGHDVMGDVVAEREKVIGFAEQVRSGAIRAANGETFTDVVNIGIGGSDLGPAMAARALSPFSGQGPRAHFVSNVDGADLADTLKTLDPARTLFIISSKTFTTQETMTNAASARAVIAKTLGEAAVGDHFAAVSTKLDLVAKFGIKPERVFGFWDWVGGRYSIWAAIGLSLAIAIGRDHFEAFLRGAHEVDTHFVDAPLERNIPVLMALIGVWNRDTWGYGSQAVIPYDQRLGRFSAYLQQLEMESNGKSVTRSGAPVAQPTAPVIWGEPGTNGQHAFFQMLHQGTDIIPVDFIVAAEPTDADAHHHDLLVANCLAQSEAMMRGRSRAEVEVLLQKQGLDAAAIAKLAPHKVFAGNRPTSTIMYKRLDPRTLGRLIALYEHKVFVQSVLWDINAFDQWGVELGKELCNRLAPIVSDKTKSTDGLDASTAGLINYRRSIGA